ncbi:TPA: hypothetical protein ACH3X3_003303 [Trebouxia sp. C0006]
MKLARISVFCNLTVFSMFLSVPIDMWMASFRCLYVSTLYLTKAFGSVDRSMAWQMPMSRCALPKRPHQKCMRAVWSAKISYCVCGDKQGFSACLTQQHCLQKQAHDP